MGKLTAAQLQQVLGRTKKQSRISNGFSKMSRSGRRIPKYKLEAGSSQIFIIPLHMGLPFNPFDLEDTSYSANNPFIFQCSVEKCFLQALFGKSCKVFLENVASPNWRKLQSPGW